MGHHAHIEICAVQVDDAAHGQTGMLSTIELRRVRKY